MASVSKHRGAYRIQVVVGNKRPAIRLVGVDKKEATSVARHLEALNSARLSGIAPRADTAAWLGSLPDETVERIVAMGLTEPRTKTEAEPEAPAVSIDAFIGAYIASRPDVKPGTLRIWNQTRRLLVEHFGNRCLRTINPFDARGFHSWLVSSEFAAASVSKHTGFTRQFFAAAIDAGLITVNPFSRIKLGNRTNPSRQQFVEWSLFEKVLDGCDDPEFRLVLVLSRIGGLRIPSELQGLKWQHIDRKEGKILIHSPKTARYAGGESRSIPLFPELVPYLDEWWDRAPDRVEFVIPSNRGTEAAWRTRLAKLLDRLGIDAWPRLYHNLRSSRQTELESRYPTHVVCKWLGNSPDVARQHYLQVREGDYRDAAERCTHECTQYVAETTGNMGKATSRRVVKNRVENDQNPCFSAAKGTLSTEVDGNRTHLTPSQSSRRV